MPLHHPEKEWGVPLNILHPFLVRDIKNRPAYRWICKPVGVFSMVDTKECGIILTPSLRWSFKPDKKLQNTVSASVNPLWCLNPHPTIKGKSCQLIRRFLMASRLFCRCCSILSGSACTFNQWFRASTRFLHFIPQYFFPPWTVSNTVPQPTHSTCRVQSSWKDKALLIKSNRNPVCDWPAALAHSLICKTKLRGKASPKDILFIFNTWLGPHPKHGLGD